MAVRQAFEDGVAAVLAAGKQGDDVHCVERLGYCLYRVPLAQGRQIGEPWATGQSANAEQRPAVVQWSIQIAASMIARRRRAARPAASCVCRASFHGADMIAPVYTALVLNFRVLQLFFELIHRHGCYDWAVAL